jgi:hypothetical protein
LIALSVENESPADDPSVAGTPGRAGTDEDPEPDEYLASGLTPSDFDVEEVLDDVGNTLHSWDVQRGLDNVREGG